MCEGGNHEWDPQARRTDAARAASDWTFQRFRSSCRRKGFQRCKGLQLTLQAPRLVREPGFEPGTYRLGGGCSIQLSYKRGMLRSLGPGAYYRDMRPL